METHLFTQNIHKYTRYLQEWLILVCLVVDGLLALAELLAIMYDPNNQSRQLSNRISNESHDDYEDRDNFQRSWSSRDGGRRRRRSNHNKDDNRNDGFASSETNLEELQEPADERFAPNRQSHVNQFDDDYSDEQTETVAMEASNNDGFQKTDAQLQNVPIAVLKIELKVKVAHRGNVAIRIHSSDALLLDDIPYYDQQEESDTHDERHDDQRNGDGGTIGRIVDDFGGAKARPGHQREENSIDHA